MDTTCFPNVDDAAEAIAKVIPTAFGDVDTFTYDCGFRIVTITARPGRWDDVDDFCHQITSEAPLFFEGEQHGIFRLWLLQDWRRPR